MTGNEIAARTDQKTGLVNAVYWSETARRALSRADRDHSTVGVVMLDLDHFKLVNDSFGHVAGDIVLQAIGATLRREVRDRDLPGRFGGEEFVVLLPDTGTPGAVSMAERLRITISTLQVEVPIEDGQTTTVAVSTSVGVAVYPQAGTSLEEIMHAADGALYRAKRGGRNKVVTTLDTP